MAGRPWRPTSRGSGRLVNVALFTDGSPATTLSNRLARLKALNASAVASPLNLFVDGSLTLANIPYTGVSNYQGVNAGTRTITVEAAATPGATLLSTSPTLGPATDTSIALYGAAGSLGALVLADFNVSSLVTRAQVRFVNVSPALGALDVYANGTLAAARRGAVRRVSVRAPRCGRPAARPTSSTSTPPARTTPALTLPGVSLIAGNVYTIYVVGPAGAVQGIVVQDF